MKEQIPNFIDNNLFANHFLEKRLKEVDEWTSNFDETKKSFQKIYNLYHKNKKRGRLEAANESQTQRRWIDKVLEHLGHGESYVLEETYQTAANKMLRPDYTFVNEDKWDDLPNSAYAFGDAKRYGSNLDKASDKNDNTNPSYQIYNYIERLRVDWGILTNGRKWRLYSYEDCAPDTYYEVDLIKILEKYDPSTQEGVHEALNLYKYFHLFFAKSSFEGKQNFLSKVLENSFLYEKDLEEDLEDKVYLALETTVKGFFETNNIEKTSENIEKIHKNSLVFLYRVLFILNAESRELLPVKSQVYTKRLSLQHLLKEIVERNNMYEFSEDTFLWKNRLQTLFQDIDKGKTYGNFEITSYNGGLFSEEEHPFLAKNNLKGTYIEQILTFLGIGQDTEGNEVLLDYRDLNIRHLGSIYEGLLDHKFQVAQEDLVLKNNEWTPVKDNTSSSSKIARKGELYLTNDSSER